MAKTKLENMVLTIEEMENLAAEKNLEIIDSEKEEIFFLKSKRAKNPKYEVQIKEDENEQPKEELKEESEPENQPQEDCKPKQVHESKDRDIKIESGKVDDINVKLIYHRMKDDSKQYRIFLAKKIDGKLKRTRLVNEEIKNIQTDEKKMIEYYQKIINGKIQIQVA